MKTKFKIQLISFIAFVLLTQLAIAARLDGDYMHKVTTDLVTPHYSWAKPLAAGPIKALFIIPRAVAAREVVELAQRLSLDFEVVTTYSPVLLASNSKYEAEVLGNSPREKETELLTKLRTRYDVIVFANFTYDALPTEIKYHILRQVANGTGLVFIYGASNDKRLFEKEDSKELNELIGNLPWRAMDYFRQKGSIDGFVFGKGRVAHLNYGERATTAVAPGLTPPIRSYSRTWEQKYNYYLGLVAKTLIWASNKESDFSLEVIRDGMAIQRPAMPAKLQLAVNAPREEQCTITVRILDEYGRLIKSQTKDVMVQKGRVQTDIELSRLPAGSYYCEGVLKNKNGVLDWAASNFFVRDNLQLESLTFDGNKGEVKLSMPAAKDLNLDISLIDYSGRVLSTNRYLVKKGEQTVLFNQSLEKCLTKLAILKADLLDNGEIITCKEEEFYSGAQTTSPLFPTLIWGGMGDYAVSIFAKRQLKALGFDSYLEHPSSYSAGKFASVSASDLAAANADFVPYMYRIFASVSPEGWTIDQWLKNFERSSIADAAFSNPQIEDAAKKVIQRRITGIPESTPWVYSLGDENNFSYDGGYSPSEIRAFREFLKEKYGSIDVLNAVWGTNFTNWEFPIPTRSEMENAELYPARHDQMSFLEEQYASYHRSLAEYIRSIDKNGLVGAEGSEPGDLERTLAGLDFWVPYTNTRDNALIRSLRPDILRGNWWGGYGSMRAGMAKLLQLWPQVLVGNANTSWYYISHGVHGVMGADLMPAKYFSDVKDEYDEIRNRIGPLIANAKQNNDGIAIHYSIASEHLAKMLPGSGNPAVEQTVLIDILDSEGYGYKFLSTKQIESGALFSEDFKIIFLCLSQALSEKEQEELRKFVKRGGVVVADLNPGIADGNCKLNIDDSTLFGVDFQNVEYQAVSDITINSNSAFAQPVFVKSTILNPALKIKDTASMVSFGETPLIISNTIGNGKTFLLNLLLSPFKEEPAAKQIIISLLEQANVIKSFAVETEDEKVAKSYKNGEQEIVTVYFPQTLTNSWSFKLTEPRHVWDSRSGQYLGFGSEFEIPVYSERQPAYVLTMEKENKLQMSVNLPVSCSLGESIECEIKFENDKADCRIVRIEVFEPNGELFEPFTRTVKVEGGSVSLNFDLALNDQKGTWLFKASDVSTGYKVEQPVEVK